MTRKYATTLENNITRFVRKFGIKRSLYSEEHSFVYWEESNVITFDIMWHYENDLLINFINEKYDANIEPWFFVFCILHEVGHHKTLHLLTEEDRYNERILRTLANVQGLNNTDTLYFNLPAEVLATDWAIEYMKNNLEECRRFQAKCMKILAHIYNKKSFKKFEKTY